MARKLVLLLLLALGACTALPTAQRVPSPCDAGEASYACQVERYHNISG
ncbi:MAG TPA: hypothetical protein VFM98_18695 [Ramlibacter sp.]|nr:hypothetical protein [Ramlibacter sp.]HET8747634.1 hypothetical protein [Ramlibacter sp.]